MSKATAGPWTVDRRCIEGPDGNIALLNLARAESETSANARLMAAAPDLLAACKAVAGMAVAWQPLTPGDIAEVTAAIAKAEGRESER